MVDEKGRREAISALDGLIEGHPWLPDEISEAWLEFCGDGQTYDDLPDHATSMGEDAFHMWFALDRALEDGRRPVELLLDAARGVRGGARAYLESLARTSVRLYEVTSIVPGQGLGLRDMFGDGEVRVRERTLSRSIEPHAMLAARIITESVSGEPEIERGVLPIPRALRAAVLQQLGHARESERRGGRSELEIDRRVAHLYHQAWLSAFRQTIPNLANTDGETLIWTKLVFRVVDRDRALRSVRSLPDVVADGDDKFTWVVKNPNGNTVSLAAIEFKAERLFAQVNSVERGERARNLLEAAAGDALQYRMSVQEDVKSMVERHDASEPTSPDVALESEEMEAAVLDHYARHYRSWIDEEIPMLGGSTPRSAAQSKQLRPKLIEMLKDLEHAYYRALSMGQPAFDPHGIWDELGLVDDPRAPRTGPVPPPLAHESFGRLVPGFTSIVREVTKSLRTRPDFDGHRTIEDHELSDVLSFQRYLRRTATELNERMGTEEAISDANHIGFFANCAINHELHHRKTFWIAEGLSTMLDQTDADPPGELLRLPFPSFAIVFTDRHFLGMAERILAIEEEDAHIRGQRLRVATVYVREVTEAGAEADATNKDGPRTIRVTFAFDPLGSDWPYVMSRVLSIDPAKSLQDIAGAHLTEIGGLSLDSKRLVRLVRMVLNSILYATSAGVESKSVHRAPPKTKAKTKRPQEHTSDEVFHLPGHIDIQVARNVRALERAPGGRQILHRFMVRGHWRQPNPTWTDQKMRWIEPHWKGPEFAAVIERSYRIKPGDVADDDATRPHEPA